MGESIRLLIVDDHDQVRRELAARLSRRLNLQVVGQASQAEEAMRLTAELQPDVILLDSQMSQGLAICRKIVEKHPAARILVLGSFADEGERQAAYAAGAAGYMPKDIPSGELMRGIEALHAGS